MKFHGVALLVRAIAGAALLSVMPGCVRLATTPPATIDGPEAEIMLSQDHKNQRENSKNLYNKTTIGTIENGSKNPHKIIDFLENQFNPQRVRWKDWGQTQLQTGDLVFTRSDYRVFLGLINFTEVTCGVTNSPMSHVGIVAIEESTPYVYDISDLGVQRTEFSRYVTRPGYLYTMVRRPHESIYPALPRVIERARWHLEARTKFDSKFQLNNESLYCTEFVVDAFDAGGVRLCEPTRIGDLPGLPTLSPWIRKFAESRTGLTEVDFLYSLGNTQEGLLASPLLYEVLPTTAISTAPPGS
jgi:hypothetical protein